MPTTTEQTLLPHPQALVHKLSEHEKTLEAYAGDPRMERAVASTALKLTEGAANKNNPTVQGLRLVASLPDFLQARNSLKDSAQLDRQSKHEAVDSMTRFNEVLRDVINYNPDMTMRQLQAYVMTAAISMGSESPMQNVDQEIRNSIDGMRHELAFEAVLYRIDGVDDVRTATPEEDRKGVDIVVSYRGRELKIDVKASQMGAESKAKKSSSHNSYDNVPMWSGVSWDDFGNQLRIADEDVIYDQAQYVADELDRLYATGNRSYVHELANIT